ncbi:MAG: zf-HC2 domain-containing protein [Dehalococcoidia bacterium]
MFGHKSNNECERIREKISPYLDDRLEPVERDKVIYHAERCKECRYEMESMRLLRELLHLVPAAEVPRSFTLAEAPARRSWFSFEMPAISFESSMRVAATAAIVLFALIISLDFTGIISEQNTPQAEEMVGTVAVTPAPADTSTPEQSSGEGKSIPEALPPDSDSDLDVGIGVSAVPETVDPYGESGVSSPAPRSSTPSWLLPVEITMGALVILFGSTTYLLWQRKRIND